MALTKEEKQLLNALLKKKRVSLQEEDQRPLSLRILQVSAACLSVLLFLSIGVLGIVTLIKPNSAHASNTYTQTWTATNGIYLKDSGTRTSANENTDVVFWDWAVYTQGIPADGTQLGKSGDEDATFSYNLPAIFTVTAWNVSGTIQ
jgi:hypothetical protein